MRKLLIRLFTVSLVLLTGFVITVSAQEPNPGIIAPEGVQLDAAATPVPGGPGYISVNGTGFKPYLSTAGYSNVGGCLDARTDTSYLAQLQLPHGARITQIVAYYSDLNPSGDILLELVRFPFESTFSSAILGKYLPDTTSLSSTILTLGSPAVVDNSQNSYLLRASFSDSSLSYPIHLCNVRVDYD